MRVRTLTLLDTHALVHRFFHALPPLTTPPPLREPIGAIYGFASVLSSLVAEDHTDFFAAALDRPEPTFRKELAESYKAHRPPAPSDLVSQLKRLPSFLADCGIPAFSAPGFEADDVIGTLVARLRDEPDIRIVIVTGDLDLLQLVEGERVVVRFLKSGLSNTTLYDERAVVLRFSFPPRTLPDYKALVGDATDNIEGVAGVGPKTARELLREFPTLEEIYENIGLVPRATAEKLARARERAFLSRQLAMISRDAPLPLRSLPELRLPADYRERLARCFRSFGFESLVRRLGV